MLQQVIEVKNGKVRVPDYELYLEFQNAVVAEHGTAKLAGEDPVCDEVCADHGGVKECGQRYIWCNDGTAWLRRQ